MQNKTQNSHHFPQGIERGSRNGHEWREKTQLAGDSEAESLYKVMHNAGRLGENWQGRHTLLSFSVSSKIKNATNMQAGKKLTFKRIQIGICISPVTLSTKGQWSHKFRSLGDSLMRDISETIYQNAFSAKKSCLLMYTTKWRKDHIKKKWMIEREWSKLGNILKL